MITWIMISIGVLVVLLLVLFIFLKSKKKIPTDYYALFSIGIVWLVIGIPLRNFFMSGIGAVFMAVSLANKDKWEKNRRTWEKMSKEERQIMMIVIAGGIILLVAGVAAFLLVR